MGTFTRGAVTVALSAQARGKSAALPKGQGQAIEKHLSLMGWEKEEYEESKAEGQEREARLHSETLTRGLIPVGFQGYVIPLLTPLSPGDLFHLVDF